MAAKQKATAKSTDAKLNKKSTKESSVSPSIREEAEAWEKSRLALERKARLYEQLHRGEDPGGKILETCLVDFDRKPLLDHEAHVSDALDSASATEKLTEIGECRHEFIDEFGRSRLVSQKELDALLAEQRQSLESSEEPSTIGHYDPRGEIRNRAVGHYAFSRDREERSLELAQLNQLRSETEANRLKVAKIKEKQRALREARLQRILERRRNANS